MKRNTVSGVADGADSLSDIVQFIIFKFVRPPTETDRQQYYIVVSLVGL